MDNDTDKIEETDFDKLLNTTNGRGDTVSPLLPNANWISLKGNFTPSELRIIANEVESTFNGK